MKPANTGSSVGITKAHDFRELELGLEQAFRYDRKAVVEAAVDAREIECSVLGNDEMVASVPGEIIPCNEFYDYEAKYLAEGSRLIIPAEIPPEVSEKVRRIAVAAFRAVDGAGMARVDFFLERSTHALYLNELNTIPGFTPISMYPKLWEASGVSYRELLDRLIALALERHADKQRCDTDFHPAAGGPGILTTPGAEIIVTPFAPGRFAGSCHGRQRRSRPEPALPGHSDHHGPARVLSPLQGGGPGRGPGLHHL